MQGQKVVYYRTMDGRMLSANHANDDANADLALAPQMTTWKEQLLARGYATCPHKECGISFLSISGIVAHFRTCLGIGHEYSGVACDLCGAKFRIFNSMQKHREKAHFKVLSPNGSKIFVKQQLPVSDSSQHLDPEQEQAEGIHPVVFEGPPGTDGQYAYDSAFLEDEMASRSRETTADKTARIMAESRLISTARPRGRPPKKKLNVPQLNKQNLQYSDPFDILEVELRERLEPSSPTRFELEQRQVSFHQIVPPQQQQQLKMESPPQGSLQEHHVVLPSSSLNHLHQFSMQERILPEIPQQTPIFQVQQPRQQILQQAPADSSTHSNSSVIIVSPCTGKQTRSASSESPFVSVPSSSSSNPPANPPNSNAPLLNQQNQSTPTSTAPQRGVMSPVSIASTSLGGSGATGPAFPPSTSAESSYSSQAPKTSEEIELDEREQKLKEDEAKLADYEKLVLQSERMAAEVRRAKLEERERQVKKKQEELQKRLAEAVQTLEDAKSSSPACEMEAVEQIVVVHERQNSQSEIIVEMIDQGTPVVIPDNSETPKKSDGENKERKTLKVILPQVHLESRDDNEVGAPMVIPVDEVRGEVEASAETVEAHQPAPSKELTSETLTVLDRPTADDTGRSAEEAPREDRQDPDAITPDETAITLNEATITLTEVTITPDNAAISPDEAGITPDEAQITPHEAGITPDEAQITPHEAGITPNEAQITPHETAITPDEATITPDETAVTPDKAAITPDEAAVTPDKAAITPDNAAVTPDKAAITPDNAAIAPNEAAVTPDEATITLTEAANKGPEKADVSVDGTFPDPDASSNAQVVTLEPAEEELVVPDPKEHTTDEVTAQAAVALESCDENRPSQSENPTTSDENPPCEWHDDMEHLSNERMDTEDSIAPLDKVSSNVNEAQDVETSTKDSSLSVVSTEKDTGQGSIDAGEDSTEASTVSATSDRCQATGRDVQNLTDDSAVDSEDNKTTRKDEASQDPLDEIDEAVESQPTKLAGAPKGKRSTRRAASPTPSRSSRKRKKPQKLDDYDEKMGSDKRRRKEDQRRKEKPEPDLAPPKGATNKATKRPPRKSAAGVAKSRKVKEESAKPEATTVTVKQEDGKIACQYCKYRMRPKYLERHMDKWHWSIAHPEVVGQEEKEKSPEPEENGGRLRRRAARNATRRMAEAINVLKTKNEGSDNDIDKDDDEEDAFNVSTEIDAKSHYDVINTGSDGKSLKCKLCEETFLDVKAVEAHILSDHTGDLNPEDDEEGEEDSEVDEEEDNDFSIEDDEESVKGGKSKRKSTGSYKYKKTNKPNVLAPNYELVPLEAAFRKKSFDISTFDDLHTSRGDWHIMGECADYLPTREVSAKFLTRCAATSKKRKTCTLPRFGFIKDEKKSHTLSFFAGDPIWAAAWCPQIKDCGWRYLAVSTEPSSSSSGVDCRLPDRPDCESGLLQIWRFDADLNSAEMVLGLAHNFGRMWNLQWCPSGNQADKKEERGENSWLSRLGLLASACADGTVRIFSVCTPESLRAKSGGSQEQPFICSVNPSLTLRTAPGPSNLHCLAISWYRGPGHRVIAGSFSDGSFALWDLLQPEDSLQRDGQTLFPYRHVLAHTSSATSIDLYDRALGCSPADQGCAFPAACVTGSSDRYISLWDLSSPEAFPRVQTAKRGFISTVACSRHVPAQAAVSFDDVFLQSHTQTLQVNFVGSSNCSSDVRSYPVMAHNSPVWSQAISPWLNTMVTATAAGELVLYVPPSVNRPMEHDKDTSRRRVFLFRTERIKDEDLYAFVDSPLDDFSRLPLEEQKLPRNTESMSMEDLEDPSDSLALYRVAHSADRFSAGFVFTGGQLGIGRVLDIRALVGDKKFLALSSKH